MDEATLTRKLEASLNDSSLVLQVAFAVPYVQVVINRTQLPPDYPALRGKSAFQRCNMSPFTDGYMGKKT